jgi:hypothetical protein
LVIRNQILALPLAYNGPFHLDHRSATAKGLKTRASRLHAHPGPKRLVGFCIVPRNAKQYGLARSHAGGGDRYQSYGSVGAAQFSVADIHT